MTTSPSRSASTSCVARVAGILRRGHREADHPEAAVLRLPISNWTRTAHEVFKGGQAVQLSLTEFKLLRCLLENPGG